MRFHKKLYSPFLVIGYSIIFMIIGITLSNIALFLFAYYLAVTGVIVFNKKRKPKFIAKNITVEYWEKESQLKEIIDNNNVDLSREYFDISPIPRHQTTYTTHPNPKFER